MFSADWRSWASALLSICSVGFFSGGVPRANVLFLDGATGRRFGFALSHGGHPRACGRCWGRSPPPPAARLLPPSEAAPRPGPAPPSRWVRGGTCGSDTRNSDRGAPSAVRPGRRLPSALPPAQTARHVDQCWTGETGCAF